MSETTEEKSEEKSEKSGKLSSIEPRKPRTKPPFKLCFVLREEQGRSYILPSRPRKIAFPILTPKFYSKHEFQECEDIDTDILNELKRLREIGPKEKSDEPITENQRYGWYMEPSLEAGREDRRLHFPRQVTELVKLKALIDHADSITKPRG